MTLFLSLLGASLILVALRDIFDTLFHPSGKGMLSRAIPAFSGVVSTGSVAAIL